MRTYNVIFGIIAVVYLEKILNKKKISNWYVLLMIIQPMFVYYMNDVGPYIILLALSMAFIYYCFFSENISSTRNIIMINTIFLIGVLTHFIFGFIYILYILKILLNKKDKKIKKHLKIFAFFFPIYLILLIAYMKYMQNGSERGWNTPGIKNILYVIYCFLGYQGTFLSRNELRAGNFSNFNTLSIIETVIITIGYIVLLFDKKNNKVLKSNKELIMSGTLYFFIFFICSIIFKFQFWERHLISLYTIYLIIFIQLIENKIKEKDIKIINKNVISALIVIIMLIVSSINIRFNYYYNKDDYKGIVNYLNENVENNDIILLQGDNRVYKLYQYEKEFNIIEVNNKEKEEIEKYIETNKKRKIYIVLSEKFCDKNLYNSIENSNKSFNTFKIIVIDNKEVK